MSGRAAAYLHADVDDALESASSAFPSFASATVTTAAAAGRSASPSLSSTGPGPRIHSSPTASPIVTRAPSPASDSAAARAGGTVDSRPSSRPASRSSRLGDGAHGEPATMITSGSAPASSSIFVAAAAAAAAAAASAAASAASASSTAASSQTPRPSPSPLSSPSGAAAPLRSRSTTLTVGGDSPRSRGSTSSSRPGLVGSGPGGFSWFDASGGAPASSSSSSFSSSASAATAMLTPRRSRAASTAAPLSTAAAAALLARSSSVRGAQRGHSPSPSPPAVSATAGSTSTAAASASAAASSASAASAAASAFVFPSTPSASPGSGPSSSPSWGSSSSSATAANSGSTAPPPWVSHSNRDLLRVAFRRLPSSVSASVGTARGILDEARFPGLDLAAAAAAEPAAKEPSSSSVKDKLKRAATMNPSSSAASASANAASSALQLAAALQRPPRSAFNVIVSGAGGSGKTATLANISGRSVPSKHAETVGMQLFDLAWPYRDAQGAVHVVDFLFWDSGATAAAQYKYISATPEASAHVCLYTVASSDPGSWVAAQNKLASDASKPFGKLVVFTKIDDKLRREVHESDILRFQEKYNAQHFPPDASSAAAARGSYRPGSLVVCKIANWPISTEAFYTRPGVSSLLNTVSAMCLAQHSATAR